MIEKHSFERGKKFAPAQGFDRRNRCAQRCRHL
jgi:hypothetical protein